MVGHGGAVGRVVAQGQQAAMNARMQGFHPPVHDFREAGFLGHVAHRQTRFTQDAGGAAGR